MESAVVRLPLPRRQSPASLATALWVDPGPLVVSKSLIVWCCCPDSNGGPTDYESVALPAELQQQGKQHYREARRRPLRIVTDWVAVRCPARQREAPPNVGRALGYCFSVRSTTWSSGWPGGSKVHSDKARRTASSNTPGGVASSTSTWSTLPSGVTHSRTRTLLSTIPSRIARSGNPGGSCRSGRSVTGSLTGCAAGAGDAIATCSGAWAGGSAAAIGAGAAIGAAPTAKAGDSVGMADVAAAFTPCGGSDRATGGSTAATFTAEAAESATGRLPVGDAVSYTGEASRDRFRATDGCGCSRTPTSGAPRAGEGVAADSNVGAVRRREIGVIVAGAGNSDPYASIASVDVGTPFESIGRTCASV